MSESNDLVIDRAEAVTPAWMSAALGSVGIDVEVVEVRTTPIGTGQMGVSLRCEIDVAGPRPAELAPTLVAKLPTPDEAKRPLVSSVYRSEVAFYREVAPTLSVRHPRCWFSAISQDAERFVLLLDDLAPALQGDQIAGCTVAQARAAVLNLAGLHGPRWCDPTLSDHSTLARLGTDDAEIVGSLMGDATELFLGNYVGRIGEADASLLREVATVMGPWILQRPERFAPIHGDYRLDNLLFGPGDDDVSAVDWQTVSLGLPARDLAYFLATSLDPALRAAHEAELVGAYHGALRSLGVADHSAEECFDDYRFAQLQGPLITIMGAAYSERTDRGDDMFVAMATRSCRAIRDLGTLELMGSG